MFTHKLLFFDYEINQKSEKSKDSEKEFKTDKKPPKNMTWRSYGALRT